MFFDAFEVLLHKINDRARIYTENSVMVYNHYWLMINNAYKGIFVPKMYFKLKFFMKCTQKIMLKVSKNGKKNIEKSL